jgi:formyltetrahydrofolate deformylase
VTKKKSRRDDSAILLIHCPDSKGIVARVTQFVLEHDGNILHLEQHVDHQSSTFFMRLVWDMASSSLDRDSVGTAFEPLAQEFQMNWDLRFGDHIPRMAIFVSKSSHCLYELLSRYQSGEWRVEVPVVISNHEDLAQTARAFGVNYHVFPVTKETKHEQEARMKALLRDYDIDFIVLARYMQVLSSQFLKDYPNRVINIHHSFLPAFPGARPYHQAYARGVKIIGATSHYVTEDLDAGPIIEQDVTHVSHRNSVKDFIRKGRDLEKIVLARGVFKHLEHKVLVFNNKTVIFD